MTEQTTINSFLSELSSKSPTPGGGGASALGGAIGTSLGLMVGNLTLGKKKYADVQAEVSSLIEQLKRNQNELLVLIEEDAKAFEPLAKAYALPKATPEETTYKEKTMEEALYAASLPPLSIMQKAYEGICLLKEMGEIGTKIAISDVAVGVQFLKAALLGASMNVFINTRSMKDCNHAAELNHAAQKLIAEGSAFADEIFNEIMEQMR